LLNNTNLVKNGVNFIILDNFSGTTIILTESNTRIFANEGKNNT